ncbi:MAG: helix-turn-helix transcriptional regulator [Aggregatilineales bacterium]
MNRIDRLFAILLRLRTQPQVRAIDLAGHFEVSERTIYRDMSALMQMGVPIIAQAGHGYQLMPGFYLPPLLFTVGEAKALLLGLEMLQESGNLQNESSDAREKLMAAMPEKHQNAIHQQADFIQFIMPDARFKLDDTLLMTLQRAILKQRVLHLHYHSLSDDKLTGRDVEAHALTYSNGTWYLSAYCRLREAMRSFRLDRIEKLQLRPERFIMRDVPAEPEREIITIMIKVHRDYARWLHEQQHYGFTHESAFDDHYLLMHYQVFRHEEIQRWLMSFGAEVEVVSPIALRTAILQDAKKLVALLT